MTGTALTGALLVLVGAALWGTSGVAAALAPTVSPVTVGALTLAVSGVVLGLLFRRGVRTVLRSAGVRLPLSVAAVALGVYIVCFFAGMRLAGVALGTVVAIASAPLFVGAIDAALARRLPTARWGAAATVTIVGSVLLVLARGGDADAGDLLIPGILLASAAGLSYAVFTWVTALMIAPTPARSSGLPASAVIATVHAVLCLPLLVVASLGGLPAPGDGASWLVMVYIGLVPTAIGYLLYAQGLARTSPTTAALLTLLEPVIAAVLAVALLGESLSALGWCGVALTVTGLATVTFPARRLRVFRRVDGAA